MLRILIADDHEVLRKGVRELIEGHPDWQVCGEASDGEQALELAHREKPDIAVLDVTLPILNGVALTQRILKECPGVKVLLFTMRDDDETVRNGLAAGARGYVLKSDSESHLEAAISAVGSNRPYFSSPIFELLLDAALNSLKKRARRGKASKRVRLYVSARRRSARLAPGKGRRDLSQNS